MADTHASAIPQPLPEGASAHERLWEASAGVRDISRRVRKMPRYQVIEDKTVYDRARESAAALTAAGRRLAGKPPPEPPRRRSAPAVLVLLVTGAVVYWAVKRQREMAAQTSGVAMTSAEPAPLG